MDSVVVSRRCSVAGRQQSWGRFGECAGHHRGLRAGHVSIGGTRELGRALWLLDAHPGLGDRVTKGPGAGWALRPGHEPCGDTTNERSTQGIGERATSEGPREGQEAVVALHSTVAGGEVRPKRPTEGKATSGRVFRWVRYTRETPSSPIVSPHPHWTVWRGSCEASVPMRCRA